MRKQCYLLLMVMSSLVINSVYGLTDDEKKDYFVDYGKWPAGDIPGFTSITDLIDHGWTWTEGAQLNIDGAYLQSLDGVLSITGISQVKYVSFPHHVLTTVTDALCTLTNIQALDLANNLITSIPENMSNLVNLQHCALNDNALTSLPDSLVTMTWLATLNLENNSIIALPSGWDYLIDMPMASLYGNPVVSLESKKKFATTGVWPHATTYSFTSITDLIDHGWTWTPSTTLSLDSSRLETLDGLLSVPGIYQVHEVDFSYNELIDMPEILTTLTQLVSINLSHNMINTISTSLDALINLSTLNLSDNFLTTLPDDFASLYNLVDLQIFDNEITNLPDSLLSATWISCNCINNRIATIPYSTTYQELTEHIDFGNNPIAHKVYFATHRAWGTNPVETFDSINELKHLGWVNPYGPIVDVTGAHLTSLDGIETLSYAHEVTELKASFNKLTSLSNSVTVLSAVETINLNNNQFTTVPAVLAELPLLTDLSISRNTINDIDAGFFNAPNIVILDLSVNTLTTMSSLISSMTTLQALNIAGNFLSDLPSGLASLPVLALCNARYNQIQALSDTATTLQAMITLDLIGNPVPGYTSPDAKKVVSSIDRKRFFITNRRWKDGVKVGFDSIQEMLSLGWSNQNAYGIDVSNAGLKSLQGLSQIPGIANAEVLYAHKNTLTEIPAEIACMSSLKTLHAQNNALVAVDDALATLPSLCEVYLQSNQLTDIPAGIYQVPSIRFLDLSNNLCVTLTSATYTMTNLERLFLNNNQLISLPLDIDGLTELQELQLNNNYLSSLPRGIGKMQNLKYLHIEDNNLSLIPANFAQNANIFMVNAIKNTFTYIPSELSNNVHVVGFFVDFECTNTEVCAVLKRLNPNHTCQCMV